MTLAAPRAERRIPGLAAALQGAGAGLDRIGRLPWPVAAYLFFVLLPANLHLGPLYLTTLRLFLVVMIIPLVIRLLGGAAGRIIATDILFMLHMAWAGVALQVNNPEMAITQIGSLGPEFLGGYLIARLYIRTRAQFVALCRWLVLSVCVLLPFALIESVTGTPYLNRLVGALPLLNGLFETNESRLGLYRVQVVFSNPIHFGLYCSTAVSLAFIGLKDVIPTGRRLLFSAIVCLSVFLSLSSGAFLAMIMHLFLIAWGAVFLRTGRPWLLLVILAVLAYVAIDLMSNRTPVRVFFSYATFSPHTAYWRGIIFEWGMKNVWANPIYGIGLNDWERPSFMFSGSMDNFWLVMGVRYGIPGFLLIAAGYLIALWRVGRCDLGDDIGLQRLRRAWMFTFVGLTFTLCTVHVWTNVYSYVFFLFGAGMWFLTAGPQATAQTGQTAEAAARPGARRGAQAGTQAGIGPAPAAPPDPPAPTGRPRHTRFPQTRRRQA